MSNVIIKLNCRKCHAIMSGDSEEQVCDNCNMDLIAQNLAAELLQHEVHQEESDDIDNSIETTVETSQGEISISETVEEIQDIQEIHEIQLPFVELTKMDSNEVILESSLASEDMFVVASTSLEIEVEESEDLETEQPDEINQEEEISYQGSDIIIGLDEPDNIIEVEEVVECLPSTSAASPIETENIVTIEFTADRKRKFDETTEIGEGSKSKDEDSSDDEQNTKKPDIKPEPMRTRAKVVQEEAAAMKQHDLSMDEDRLGENDEGDEEDDSKGPVRRLTRKAMSEIEKYKHPSYEPTQSKSRRTKTFKAKTVYKAPTSQARIYSSDYVFYKGRYYQVGDVVLLRDLKRPGDFFAQITSFLTDQYCHKCATIQWLFPTKQSPRTGFDPRTYFLGFIDEIPRPLSSLQPVMHLPSDYYRFNKTPYPPPTPDPLKKHFLWKRTEPISLEAMLQGC